MANQQTTTKKMICGLCACNCILQVEADASGIRSLAGDPLGATRGFACLKGLAWREIIEQQSQLKSPLQRQGENGWREISYDQALDLLAEQLVQIRQRHGADAFVFHSGQAGVRRRYPALMNQLAKAYGSPNFSTIGVTCNISRQIAYRQVLGGLPKCDYAHAETIVLWGNNSANTHPFDWQQIRESCAAGAALLVITPRLTEGSRRADHHLALLPGTDIYLAWAMLKLAVDEQLYDPEYVAAHVNGFEELAAAVSRLDFAELCSRCGLPQAAVRQATEQIMHHGPTAIMVGSEVELQTYGNDAARAIAMLQGLAGTTALMFMPKPRYQRLPGDYATSGAKVGAAEYPVFTDFTRSAQTNVLPREIENGAVKGMLVIGGNPLATWADSERVGAAFRQLEHLAVMDCRLTATAELADLVLPAAGHGQKYELIEVNAPDGKVYLNLSEPVAPTEHLNEVQVIHELAKRLGLEAACPWEDSPAYFDYLLEPYGVDCAALLTTTNGHLLGSYQAGSPLPTAGGKVELTAPALVQHGHQALPLPPSELPTPDGTLLLDACDKAKQLVHSRYRTVKTLSEGQKPQVKIARATAAQHGLNDQDPVTLERNGHRLTVEVKICEDMAEGSLAISHGWKKANANSLASIEDLDPVTGFPNLARIPVRLEPTAPPETESAD